LFNIKFHLTILRRVVNLTENIITNKGDSVDKFFAVLRDGDKYLKSWPKQQVLNCLFVDSKIAFYTRLSTKVLPAFIVLMISLSFVDSTLFQWSTTATFVLFLASLPLQGLYWMGKRAQSFLPTQILPWYIAIDEKVNGKKEAILSFRPRYHDLAHLLKHAFKIGGDDFLRNNELI
jgi:uncharacterized membrane protein YfbV (UPF0208 family)